MQMQKLVIDKTGFDRSFDPVSASGVMRWAIDFQDKVNGILNGEQPFGRMLFSNPTELAITSGTLAATSLQMHTVAAESGTSDELENIPAANNTLLFLKAKTGHSIVIKNGTGNITNPTGIDVRMTGGVIVLLCCQGGQWSVIGNHVPFNNLTALADPGSSQDALAGYSVGSLWLNTVLDRVWECVDSSNGAAIWKLITPWKNWFGAAPTGTGGTLTGIGVNTGAGGSPGFNANDNNNTWVMRTSSGVGVERIGFVLGSGYNYVRPAYNPILQWLIQTGSNITSQKIYVGFTTPEINTDVDDPPASTKFIGFRYSTTSGHAGWTPILDDGTNLTTGTTIGTVAPSTGYKLRVRIDANLTTAYFSVNDSPEQALQANFPAIATDMDLFANLITNGVARSLLSGSVEVGW